MNNRDYKKFHTGGIFHIYNRGNNKEKIFFENQDYRAFLFRLGLGLGFSQEELSLNKFLAMPYSRIRITVAEKSNFKLHAFALMPNHFHLLIEQTGRETVSKLIAKVCTSYAKYINLKYKRVGHIFQDKFKAVLIQNHPQLIWTSAYIHMNPVKDRIVRNPEEYLWSSYPDYVCERNLPITTKSFLTSVFGGKENFEKETLNFSTKEADPIVSKTVFDS